MKKLIKKTLKLLTGLTAVSAAASYGIFYSNMKRCVGDEMECEPWQKDENPFQAQARAGKRWNDAHTDIRRRLELNREGCHLVGYYFDQGAEKTVILVHGIRSYYRNRLADAQTYFARGYNVLAVNLRGAGESDGRFYTMGYPDCDDVIGWARYLVKQEGQKHLILDGVSMGASTVLAACGRPGLPREVKGVVADCGFTSADAITRHLLQDLMHLPLFPVYYFCVLYGKLILKIELNRRTPLEGVKKSRIPILFIHGTEDTFVPYSMVDELYEACRSEKYIERVEGAAHALSWQQKTRYRNAVNSFLDKIN